MGRVRARKVVRLGPVRLHFTQAGFSSWSVKVGPWSWNSRARRHRVDLPGPWSWTSNRQAPPDGRRGGRHRGEYRDGAERRGQGSTGARTPAEDGDAS